MECAHPTCTCRHDADEMVEKGDAHYCSDACASQDPGTDSCSCGHADCDA